MRALPLLILALACPLAMWFMMRGGHRHDSGQGPDHHDTRDERIADLERELARLRNDH